MLSNFLNQKDYKQGSGNNHFKIVSKDLEPHNIIKTVIVHFSEERFLYTVVTRHSKDQRFKGIEQISSVVSEGKPYRNQVQNLHVVCAKSVKQTLEVFKLFPLFQKLNIGFDAVASDSNVSVRIPKIQYLTINSRIPENLAKAIKGLKQLRFFGCFDASIIQNNGNTLRDLTIHQPVEDLVNLDFQIKSQLNILQVLDGNELRCSNFLKNQQMMTDCILRSCSLDVTKEETLDLKRRNNDLTNLSLKIKFA
ncbi:hypothetical protein ACFFRR_003242 [Megaselia abdita]